jgi:hypothetical protein
LYFSSGEKADSPSSHGPETAPKAPAEKSKTPEQQLTEKTTKLTQHKDTLSKLKGVSGSQEMLKKIEKTETGVNNIKKQAGAINAETLRKIKFEENKEKIDLPANAMFFRSESGEILVFGNEDGKPLFFSNDNGKTYYELKPTKFTREIDLMQHQASQAAVAEGLVRKGVERPISGELIFRDPYRITTGLKSQQTLKIDYAFFGGERDIKEIKLFEKSFKLTPRVKTASINAVKLPEEKKAA